MAKAKEVHSTHTNVIAFGDFRNKRDIAPTPKRSAAASVQPSPSPSRDAIRRRYNSDDPIFFEIERHRHAAEIYRKLVDSFSETEGTAIAEELAELEHRIDRAFYHLVLFTRCLMILNVNSRAGLIALARFLQQLLTEHGDNCPYLPQRPGDEPWARLFMRHLAGCLRKMGKDFPPAKRSKKGKTVAS